MTTVELEVRLYAADAESNYGVELIFNRSDDDALSAATRGKATFDFNALKWSESDAGAYGKLLANSLLADNLVLKRFERAHVVAQALEVPLRIRLSIMPGAEELHALHWEALCDPDRKLLLTGEQILFSRFVGGDDDRPLRLRPRHELRALVVVANPQGLEGREIEGYRFAEIKTTSELARATNNLEGIPVQTLSVAGEANLNNITGHLRDGYDILYLVCHGMVIDGEPWLWLEDNDGGAARVSGNDLITRISELTHRPRLIVFASCQSADNGEWQGINKHALSALGPRLAAVGIPAVLAMQGQIAIETAEIFITVFFRELQRDGQLDRAAAVARGAVQNRQDGWMPILFMRLKEGRIWWYIPGFASEDEELRNWPDLLTSIRDGCCTPVLGAGLGESFFGPRRDLAKDWAERYGFPYAPYQRDDLTQVAQFLAVDQSPRFPRAELREYIKTKLQSRLKVPDADASADVEGHLDELTASVWFDLNAREPANPHKILASLPLPIYINTNPDGLLTEALKEVGKPPQLGLFEWQRDRESPDSVFVKQGDYRPSVKHPLVYHLFGHVNDLDTLVLTEDNFFDYLIGFGLNKDMVPAVVRRYLTDASLLFLGFQLEDWSFRVLFRSIMRLAKGGRLDNYSHVAVQIDPSESRSQDIDRAYRLLREYFQQARISIYRGSIEDFTGQLRSRWRQKYGKDLI